jgi:hypothetical protein
MNSSTKEKIALVPLEGELKQSHRKREVLDQLNGILGRVDQIMGGGLKGEKFAAYDAFKKAVVTAIGVVKNFRG